MDIFGSVEAATYYRAHTARQNICVCEDTQKTCSFSGKRMTGSLGTNFQSVQSIKFYPFMKEKCLKRLHVTYR